MNTRALFLLNPSSNGGKAALYENELRAKIEKFFPQSELTLTKADESYWKWAELKLLNFDFAVACGGDGTVHKTGNIAANLKIPLGIIPLGSGNDFACMMKIPANPDRALERLRSMNLCRTDLIKIEGDLNVWCLNTAGLGLDGLTNRLTEAYKSALGRFAYLAGVLKAVAASVPMNVTIRTDEKPAIHERLLMFTACNGIREGGAFIVSTNADPRDGRMELLRIKPLNRWLLYLALPQFLLRTPTYLKSVQLTQCKKLSLACSKPVDIHVDGEYADRRVQDLQMSVEKGRLNLIC